MHGIAGGRACRDDVRVGDRVAARFPVPTPTGRERTKSDDLVGARAKMLALEATKNVLIAHYGARNVMRVLKGEIVEEIRRLADDDMGAVREAIDYAQEAIITDA